MAFWLSFLNGSRVRASQRRRGVWLTVPVLGVVALGYMAAATVARPDLGFWSPDSSIRYVQLVSLLRQGYREVAVVYPGGKLDPEGRFYPVGGGFAAVRDGKVYLLYSPYFPALAAPFYQVFGRVGLIGVPLLSGLSVVSLTFAWLGRLGQWAGAAGALLVGLGTPLAVYSVVFWDHAPVTALTTGAIFCLARSLEGERGIGPVVAGVLLGLAVWLRNEAYVFAAAAMVLWTVVAGQRRLLPVALGFLLSASFVWALNWHLYGHPLGLKGLAGMEAVKSRLGGAEGWLVRRVLAAYDLLVSTERFVDAQDPIRVGTSLGVAAVIILSGWLLRLGVRYLSASSILFGGGAVVVVVGWLVATGSEVMGLLPAVPALALLALANLKSAWERLALGTTLLYVAAVVVIGSEGGLQWGPRYLLPVTPLLVWLACSGVWKSCVGLPGKLRRSVVQSAVMIGVASIVVQAAGIGMVRAQAEMSWRVESLLRAAGSQVLATGQPLFHMMGFLYFDRILARVDGPDELRELVRSYARQRVPRWTYIPFYGPAFNARAVEDWSSEYEWRFRITEDRTPLAWVMGRGRLIYLRLISYEGYRRGADR